MLKRVFFLNIIILSFFIKGFSQYTSIPDPLFEQYLIDEGIDTDGEINGQFLTANTIGIDFLSLDNILISDLTGIEAFIDLERLDARNTNFENADFSQNIMLLQLTIVNSPLNNMNITQNVNLLTLFADNCNLSYIDVSQNINLIQLSLDGNNLSSIDVSNLVSMRSFSLENNYFTTLDLPFLPSLEGLIINNNQISSIDLSNLPLLVTLLIEENNLTELDLSNNPLFQNLRCSNNSLTQLDFINNPFIEFINCDFNQLTEVKFDNTNNLREFLNNDNMLSSIDLSNMPSLFRLGIINNNNLTSIDVTQCPSLRFLMCYNNGIETPLDLTQNPLLEWLYCNDNPIPAIDTSQCQVLDIVWVSNTLVTQMDLSNNPLAETVRAKDMPNLEWADLRNGNNGILNFKSNNSPNLNCVYVDDVNSGEGDFEIDPHTTLVNNEEGCEALAIQDYLFENTLIYPNPVREILHIDTGIYEISKIVIYDVLGRKVFEENGDIYQVDVSQLKSGLFFVKLETDHGFLIEKIIKEK